MATGQAGHAGYRLRRWSASHDGTAGIALGFDAMDQSSMGGQATAGVLGQRWEAII